MSSRKTITVSKSPYRRCEKLKRDDESWSQFLHRAADALQSQDVEGEHGSNTLTKEELKDVLQDYSNDIVTRSAERTADELEARMR